MADIIYNGDSQQSNLITFNGVPNILSVQDESGGTYATITLTFVGNLASVTTDENQWYITMGGETVTNTLLPQNAKNKHFYAAATTQSIAASVAQALRNCSSVSANYTIQHQNNKVIVTAKGVGEMWTVDWESEFVFDFFDTNIQSAYMTVEANDGSAFSDLNGADITLDVESDGEYVTTLQKRWWRGEAAFDLSPLLTTLAKPTVVIPYTITIGSVKDGEYTYLGTLGENYASVGYICNQGEKYLDNSYINLAQNVTRGSYVAGVYNRTVLYTFDKYIPLSFYRGNEGSGYYTIDYLNSAKQVIYTEQRQWRNIYSSVRLVNLDIMLSEGYFQNSWYIDITIGTIKLRYKRIRPSNMAEANTRLKFINSYGGVSFIDLTGKRTVTRNVENSTYQRNIFDYYTRDTDELNLIYSKSVGHEVTVKSHLIEKDATYIYNDLMASPYVWIEDSGKKYGVIIQSVSVDELDGNNDVYEATVRYIYSDPDIDI